MAKHSNTPHVLLVDDESLIALAQKAALEERGYAVSIAATGEDAIQAAIQDQRLGIVLMDVDLGKGIDGTEAARRILAVRDIPVIFLSSHTSDEMIERTERISSYGYVVKDSGIAVIEASIKMARRLFEARSEEKARRRALEELEALQRATLRSIGDGVISCDARGKVTTINLEAEHLTGWAAEDAVGRSVEEVFDISNAITGEKAKNPVFRALAEGLVVGLANHTSLKSKSGKRRQIADSCAPIRDAEGKVFGAVLVFRDVTEEYARNEALKASEENLSRKNELLSTLLDNLSVGVFMVEAPSGKPLIANEAAMRFLGRGIMPEARRETLAEVYEARKLSTGEIYPEDEMPIVRSLRGESSRVDDMVVTRPDGTKTILEVVGSPIKDGEGKVWAGIVSFMDVTERKRAEEAIQALLAEKDLILKEVHHRIKNNMATILSLLELQASSLSEEGARTALKDAANRVMGMSILYEKLYRSKDFSGMDVGEYLESLIQELLAQFPEGPNLSVDVSFEPMRLGAKVLMPLGIIVNELVTNAMKYAFKGREGGRLRIEAKRAGEGMELTIQDDGPGFDERAIEGEGFGLVMARALCEQTGATLELNTGRGTRATIRLSRMEAVE